MGFSSAAAALPVVDLTEEVDSARGSTKAWPSKCDEVRRALEEYGCFIVEYNKISADVGSKLSSGLADLFNLPLEIKQQTKSDSEPFRGYTGQLPGAPLYEAIGFVEGTTLEGMQRFNNLMWPDQGNPLLSESVASLSKIMEEIGLVVTEMLFSSYDQSKNYESFLEQVRRSVRVQNYRIPNADDSTVLGIPAHVDKNFMTMLYQIQSDGLQVQAKNGDWISVDYSASSFIVMAAEALMAWSNGRIKPASHKVSMEKKEKARYSLGMFTSVDGLIQAPEEMVDEEHPLLFKPYVQEEYMTAYYAKMKANEGPFHLQDYCGVRYEQ